MRIAVLDSGIERDALERYNVVDSYILVGNGIQWEIHKDFADDDLGHGTAIAHIIHETNKDAEIINVKICNNNVGVDEYGLICALRFLQNIDVDVINISAGINYLDDYPLLNEICNQLVRQRKVIVSAYDNDGAISFPAALDSVIGVDVNKTYENKNEIVRIKDSIVDIVVPEKYYRTIWKDTKTIVNGTSFACAYVSGRLSLFDVREHNKDILLEMLATKVVDKTESFELPRLPFDIKSAVIFPLNKESEVLLRFQDSLSFSISAVFDDKMVGRVGSNVFGFEVRSIDTLDWDSDFDTIIISCTSELMRLTGKNYVTVLLEKAKKHQKNVYSFENLETIYERVFYPGLSDVMVPHKNRCKLYKTSIPVVGVFGTSSKQGKYTIQRQIIKLLSEWGYSVGSIATEPSGYLFDADYVFHFGYNAELPLAPWQCVAVLNEMLWNIQLSGKDVVITGCQSNTIHYNSSRVEDFAIYQYGYLLGVMPDFYVLCVNPHDEFEYIQRSIDFLNSVDVGKVGALVLFPMLAYETLSGIGYKTRKMTEEELYYSKEALFQKFNIPVFLLGDQGDLAELCKKIINELSQD